MASEPLSDREGACDVCGMVGSHNWRCEPPEECAWCRCSPCECPRGHVPPCPIESGCEECWGYLGDPEPDVDF